jgi:hypothetical protein
VGPDENSTRPTKDQKHGPAARPGCRRRSAPRARRCLLKGCEQSFPPRRVDQRYCSEACRRAARRWSRWKAQQNYRATVVGRDKRNGQSRRYRERVRNRLPAAPEEAIPETARVITKNFFRSLLRPAGLLRGIRSAATITAPTFLFACMPARCGTSLAAGAALGPRSATAAEDSEPTLAEISRTY